MQHELTNQQLQAIELLTSGTKIGCIAEKLDIRRETIWRWRQDPAFSQAYQIRREIACEEIRERMLDLVSRAVEVLQQTLNQEPHWSNSQRQLPVALTVLRMFHTAPLPAEPALPTELASNQ